MRRTTIIIITIITLVLLTGGIWGVYKSYLLMIAEIEERFEMRQVIEASSIGREAELIMDPIRDKMMIASHVSSILEGDRECQADIEEIYSYLKEKVDFVCRLNEGGVITHIVPEDMRKTLERGFNYRRCFQEVMKTGKPVVSVMPQADGGESREAKGYGKTIFTAAPLYNNGKFVGLLGAGSNLTSMLETIIHARKLKTGKYRYCWIIDSRGIFIVHPIREFIGQDAFTIRREKAPYILFEKINRIMREKMMRGEAGTDTYISGWHEGEKGKIEKLIAYAPFSLGDERYSLALATPKARVIPGDRKIFQYALVVLAIITTTILVFLYVLGSDRRRSKLLKEKTKLLEEIRESEERYRNLFKNSLDGVFTLDIEGNITSCNKVIEEILGYTTGELMGLNYRDHMAPETADYVFQRHNELFRTGRPIHGLCYEIIRKDGKKRIVESYVSLIKKGKWIEGFQGSLRDVTEQKKMEEALLESERRHKALFEEAGETRDFLETILGTSPDMVTTADKKGFITFANRAAIEALGYEGEELLGRHISEFYDRGMERAREINDLLKRDEKFYNYRMKFINREGREIPISISGALLKNREGEIIGTLGFFRDITPLVAAEEELRVSEKRYRDLVQNSIDMILMMDMQGRYTLFNRAAEEKLGCTEEEILEKDSLFLSRDDIEKTKTGVRKLLKGEQVKPFEVIVNTREGQIIAEMNISLIWEKDRAVGMMGIVRDITEKRRAEEELRASLERYQGLLQNSSDLIYTVDIEGRFTSFNRAGEEITGFAEKDILGKHASVLVPQDALEKTEAAIRKLLKGGKSERFEVNIRKLGKGLFIGEMTVSFIREEERVIGTMGIVRDITEKRRAEEELRKKNKELEDFIYSVSHDLKAPVVSIQGFSSILLTDTDYLDKLDDRGKGYLTRIQNNAMKMQMIIADLFEFSKIGMVVNNFSDVSSRQIIADVLTMLGPQLKGLKVNVERELPTIRGDGNSIYQVFENLIQNSIKYMGDTEGPMIKIGCKPRGEFYEFYVMDNGIGIDPKYHQKIFQIFQRLNDVDVEGTGVGLAIVKKIVETHGGAIRVESEKGGGATFYFTLPGVA